MIDPASCWYVIPARSGSKRLPGKNWAELGGLALWRWTMDLLQEQGLGERSLLVADSGWVPGPPGYYPEWISRPDLLADDDTPTEDVVRWVTYQLGMHDSAPVVLLQPTSPFRQWVDVLHLLGAAAGPPDVAYLTTEGKGPNGGGYVAPAGTWRSRRRILDGASKGVPVCNPWRYVDIDTPEDLEHARSLLGRL